MDSVVRRGIAKVRRRVYKKTSRLRQYPTEAHLSDKPIGMVETFNARKITGWISAQPEAFPIKVSLCLNGTPIHGTWADVKSTHNGWGETRTFRIAIKGIWDYCQRTDRLTVQINEDILPINGKGLFKKPGSDGLKTSYDLKKLLKKGYLFNHWGTLQLSKKLDLEWQRKIIDLYRKTSKILEDKHGVSPFLVYGSLLGQVREGGFIGHDNDFDVAYISHEKNGPASALQTRDIAMTLIDAGFEVEQRATAVHIHDPSDPELRIDLFHLFFNENEDLSFPFGIAGTSKFKKKDWKGLTTGDFAGHNVKIPINAEKLVEHMYGSSWRVPIAGFSWTHARTTRASDGGLPIKYMREVYWANFYKHNKMAKSSPFFDFVSKQNDIPSTIVDFGCGDGADSFAFISSGRHVLAVDNCTVAIKKAQSLAKKRKLSRNKISFVVSDVSDEAQLREKILSARRLSKDKPILFYTRLLLDSLTKEDRGTFLKLLSELTIPGDFFATEFRTDKNDESGRSRMYRYQNASNLVRSFQKDYGWNVTFEQEDSGFLKADKETILCRVIARKDD